MRRSLALLVALFVPVAAFAFHLSQPPTVTLTTTPSVIAYGDSTTLSWNSSNATICALYEPGARVSPDPVPNQPGSGVFGPFTSSGNFAMNCSNSNGSSGWIYEPITVCAQGEVVQNGACATAVPTVILSTSPSVIPYGGTTTLSWDSENATICALYEPGARVSPDPTPNEPGSRVFGPYTASGDFAMNCSNGSGSSGWIYEHFDVCAQGEVVQNGSCVVSTPLTFSASPTSGTAPLGVTFTTSGGAPGVTYTLNFGDGSANGAISTGGSATHTYTAGGSYTATMTGGGETKTASISVANPVPPITFSASPTSGTAPLVVTFSTTGGAAGLTYAVNFGDGSSGSISTDSSVSHTYSSAGSYTAVLSGNGASKTAAVSVSAPIPSLTFSASPTSGTVPFDVTFTTTGGAAGLTYTVNFGDGSSGTISTDGSIVHTYTTAGNYAAQLTGNGASQTVSIVANAPLPPLTFTVDPTSGPEPLDVVFTTTGGAVGLTYSIDFGDGSSGTVLANNSVAHTYAVDGTYTALLTGNGASLSTAVVVDNVIVGPTGTYTYWDFPTGVDLTNFDWDITVTVDPSPQKYFYSTQFYFLNNDGTVNPNPAYFGIQTDGAAPTGKIAIFSAWTGIDSYSPEYAAPFEELGTGHTVRITYPWVEGRTYRLHLAPMDIGGPSVFGEWWGAWIWDTVTQEVEFIGMIKLPQPHTKLHRSMISFTEYYGPTPSTCAGYNFSEASFTNFTASGVLTSSHQNSMTSPANCPGSFVFDISGGTTHQMANLTTASSGSGNQSLVASVAAAVDGLFNGFITALFSVFGGS